MIRYLLVPFCSLLLAGCGESAEESGPSDWQRARAADIEMADSTIPSMDPDRNTPDIPPAMRSHPLSRYFDEYGVGPMEHIGEFWIVCDEQHTAYIEDRCDEAVERGIRLARNVGIRVTRADLLDPAYWEMINIVHQMEGKARRDYYAPLPFHGRMTKMNEYDDRHAERVAQLIAELGE